MASRFRRLLMLLLVAVLLFSDNIPLLGNLTRVAKAETTWPSEFIPYTDKDGNQIYDPAGEEHPIDIDITSGVDRGVGNSPSVFVASDGNNFFVRFRLKGDPYDRKGGFLSSVWLVQLADQNNKHIATIGLDGKSPHKDFVYVANTDGTVVNQVYVTPTDGGNSVPGTRITPDGNGHYFLDLQVPISEITKVAPQVTGDSMVKLFFGSSKAANLSVINKEWMNGNGDSVEFTNLKEVQLNNVVLTPATPAIAPIITIDESPTQYSSNAITITGKTSLTTGIVSFELDGSAINKTAPIKSDGTWNLGLNDVIQNQNGSYFLTAKVTNNGLTARTSKEINISLNGNLITIDGGAIAVTRQLPHTLSGFFAGQNPQNYRIRVFQNGIELTDQADNSKSAPKTWRYQLTDLTPNQTALIEVKWTDSNGNTVHASNSQRLTYIPVNEINQLLSVAISSITGDANPAITGTSSGAVSVEIQIDGNTVEIAKPDQNGNWSILPLERPLSPGTHNITAIAKNDEGNIVSAIKSHIVTATSITIDNGPAVTTNDNKPTIRGNTNAPNGSQVTVSVGDKWSGTTTVSEGRWTVEVPENTPISPDGTYAVTAVTINSASATQQLTIDSGTAVTITSPAKQANIKDTKPVISGTAESGARVDLQIKKLGFAEAIDLPTTNGTWSYLPAEDLEPGEYTITATAYDINGNTASETRTFTISSIPELNGVSISGSTKYGSQLSATNITYSSTPPEPVTLTFQWKRDGNNIEGATRDSYQLTQTDIGHAISVMVEADGNNARGSATSEQTVIIEKEDGPTAPSAPEKQSETTTSITLKSINGQEYSINGGNTWQDSPVFEGLNPGTEYSFITRFKETSTTKASTYSEETKISTIGLITAKPVVTESVRVGDIQITGISEPSAEITIKRGELVIGSGTANTDGKWTIQLMDSVTLLEGNELLITAKVSSKVESDATRLTVLRAINSQKEILSTTFGKLTEQGNIINIPKGTNVKTFKDGLQVSPFATVEILTGVNGDPVSNQESTLVSDTMIIRVTAEDGSIKDYTVVVLKLIELTFTSDPTSIIGDGVSTSTLKATLKDEQGNPIPNIEVQFEATDGVLSNSKAVTNEDGVATITLTAPKIEDTKPITNITLAKVENPSKGLFAEKQIEVKFAPPIIKGQVLDAQGKPIPNSRVWVEIDGKTYEAFTDENGNYSIIVPRGGTYTLTIEVTKTIGGRSITTSFTQQVNVKATGQQSEEFKPNRKVSGQLFVGSDNKIVQTMGEVLPEDAELMVQVLNDPENKIIAKINHDGKYELEGFDTGKTYDVVFSIKINDQLLAGKWAQIKVAEDGQIVVQFELIDPFGLVTDSTTKELLSGVNMKLYWADTPLNLEKGRIPHTLVDLPELAEFKPNNNNNPQISTDWLNNTKEIGNYAWLVYADADYYLIGEKDGYVTYDSRLDTVTNKAIGDSWMKDGIMHIGKTMMRYDFSMTGSQQPSIKIDNPANNAYLNENMPVISGSFDASSGSTITLKIKDKTFTAEKNNHSWSTGISSPFSDGKYTAVARVMDNGLSTEDSVTFIIDTTKPELNIKGEQEVYVKTGELYADKGATASDNIDGDISNRIQVTGIPKDTSEPGSYTITYTVKDTAGNETEVSRQLIISPQKPSIVEGKADSKNGTIEISNLIPGATVTLKDKDGTIISTGIADENGKYVFTNVKQDVDYEIVQTVNGINSEALPIKLLTDEEEVDDTLRNLEIGYEKENDTWESVTSNVYLLRTDQNETDVLWSSSHPDIVRIPSSDARKQNITAEVIRQKTEKSVTITATVSKGNVKKTRTFLLIIKASGLEKTLDKTSERQVKIGESTIDVQRINVKSDNQVIGKIDKIIINESVTDAIINQSVNGSANISLLENPDNAASEFAIEINRNALTKLTKADSLSSLTIETTYGELVLNKAQLLEMSGNNLDLFIRFVPIMDDQEQREIKDNVKSEKTVEESANNKNIQVLGTPIIIETNYRGFETEVVFPLDPIADQIMNPEMLRVFIEHSDEKEVADSEIVYDNGKPIAIKFKINKFSTFTIFEILNEENAELPVPVEQPGEDKEQPLPVDPSEEDKEQPTPEDYPAADKEQQVSILPKNHEQKEDNKKLVLPDTATSNYNMFMIGLFILLIGILSLLFSRRKKVNK